MSLASASDPISTILGAVDGVNAVMLTQEIVRIPSVVGEEGELARALAPRMEEMGYDRVYLQDVLPDRPNVVGVVDSGRPGPSLVLTGHIDTKPVCLGWDDDPYSGRLAGGQLHGHAVMDMKAGVGAFVEAGAALARTKDRWRGKVLVAAVSDHMGQQQGAIKFFEEHQADFCILAELTDLVVYLGHRGRAYWDITSIGHSAHTCHRHLAVNAIAKMVPLIEEVEALRYEPQLPDWVKRALRPGALYRGRADLRGPASGRTVDDPRRVHDPDRLEAPAGRPDRRGQATHRRRGGAGPRAGSRSALRRRAGRREVVPPDRARPRPHRRAGGGHSICDRKAATYGGGSWLADTASFGNLVPTVIFGPGREPVYMPNEWLATEDIEIAAQVYAATAAILLASDE